MRIQSALVVIGILFTGCSEQSSNTEVISLIALEDVQLVEVDSVTGGAVRRVGNVPAGQVVPVVECRPRKSDIDVIVANNGQLVVAWDGKYKVIHRAFDSKKDTSNLATGSCRGLLGG